MYLPTYINKLKKTHNIAQIKQYLLNYNKTKNTDTSPFATLRELH